MATYSIIDLERLSGIKAHTIRIWEKRYHIFTPQRTETNIRLYCSTELKKLLNISMLNRHGFKISEIAGYDDTTLNERVQSIWLQSADHDLAVDSLTVAMIELDEARFEKVISNRILSLGFEKMLVEVLHPFFERIGILWQTNSINPVHEHFISNLIRQKLIVAINSLPHETKADAKTFILFLHENEWHENGLLTSYYLIKKNGHKVIYLGQSVPMEDIIAVSEQYPSFTLVTSFTTAQQPDDFRATLQKLHSSFPNQEILISGRQVSQHSEIIPKGFTVVPSIEFMRSCLLEV